MLEVYHPLARCQKREHQLSTNLPDYRQMGSSFPCSWSGLRAPRLCRSGARAHSPVPHAWKLASRGRPLRNPFPIGGEIRGMGVKNALKATNRKRRLRQAIDLIENPAVRQQALARLAATEEQTDRCTLCGAPASTPASARSAKRTRANKAESKTGSSTARWRHHGWQRLQDNGGLRVLRTERGGHGRSVPRCCNHFHGEERTVPGGAVLNLEKRG